MLPEMDNLVREDGSGSGNENTAGGGPDDEDGWDGSGGSGDSNEGRTTNGNLLIQTSGGCRLRDASRPFIAKNASLETSIIDGFIRNRHAANLFLSRQKSLLNCRIARNSH